MGSVTVDDNEWFDDLEDSLEEKPSGKSEKVMSQMETLDRKRVSRDAIGRSPRVIERQSGLVESMMKCVITDSTLEHGSRNYQVALTPRTERRYQSPLLSGRRVVSQIPRAAVSNSPLHSPRRARGGHERVRVYASPASTARLPHNRQSILQSKLVPKKEETSYRKEAVSGIDTVEDDSLLKQLITPLPTKRVIHDIHNQPSDKEVIVMKGLLWVQQDKLFSRWKERFIVLTSHYLQFFKKTSSKISEMGAFLTKVKLYDMLSVSLEDRRGYLTLVIFCQKEGRLVIRKTEGIREWYDSLNMFLTRSKITEERKMESTEQFWDRAAKKDVGKTRDDVVSPYPHMSPLRSSPLIGKSLPKNCDVSNNFLSSSLSGRSFDDDSGLESMKTSTSDSRSSSLLAAASASQSEEENKGKLPRCDTGDDFSYHKINQEENNPEYPRKEKHERGVSMAEYSKFRAKLPFITP